NMSPLGPLPQVTLGNVGRPKFGPAALGVSLTSSDPPHPVPSSPQMWKRLSQWPISWVALLPLSNGAAAVPVVPNALWRITTPSLSAGPPGNCAYPKSPPPSWHTQMLRYRSAGQAAAPPVAANLTGFPAGR